ncbi:hypothetical protein CQW23_31958 [Capsicum baccatum]|uniref:F-box associated beta-propeller type 1 domain-containing protein n=1 Tax=Capsicum baccatum TaxID=33114 RepID=A0A2G2V646_CAPBA|nr:hypothetical protein CQW23_31958 [Capsicum baccatum]
MILKISYKSCSEILALKSGMWRITGKPTSNYSSWLSDMDSLTFVHGKFHWLGLSRNESVTSYDISNEVFKEIPLPDGMFVVPDMKYVKHGFSVLGEMICICFAHRDRWKYTFNVWIMKDYGVNESWNRFFTIQSADLYSLIPEYRPLTSLGRLSSRMRQSTRLSLVARVAIQPDEMCFGVLPCDSATLFGFLEVVAFFLPAAIWFALKP